LRDAAGAPPGVDHDQEEESMPETAAKSVIVTFKRKDKRSDKKKDKVALLTAAIERDIDVFNMTTLATGAQLPRGLAPASIGFDINRYETPIITATVTEKELQALKKSKDIASVEEDAPMRAFTGGPSLLFEGQPSVTAETVPSGISQVKAPSAWDVTRGKGIKVAILDTGIDDRHPDLAANVRVGRSFVPHETSTMDHNGHGTHCAGTVAAALTGSGVVGVAPAASLYPVKVLDARGSGNFSWLIAALDWCIDNEIHIASMSLGAPAAPSAVGAMCDLAFAKGVLLVAAAGNSGGPVGFPAAFGSVIAVSAIDSANVIAGFSCRGREIELAAPGVDVLSSAPGGGYARLNGTSMACPHVSGAAALAWGSHRFPTGGLAQNVTIRRLLAHTATELGDPGRDELFGFGRVDAEQAAFALTPPPEIPGLP
jgi:subtilisin